MKVRLFLLSVSCTSIIFANCDKSINSADDLQNLKPTSGTTYCLTADIDLESKPFQPINGSSNYFVFDGQGHTIKNLTETNGSGLFTNTEYLTVKNLQLINANITNNRSFTGALVDLPLDGLNVSNVAVIGGNLYCDTYCGGFAGAVTQGQTTIESSYSSINITFPTKSTYVGGLVGFSLGELGGNTQDKIIDSYYSGIMKGESDVYIQPLIGNSFDQDLMTCENSYWNKNNANRQSGICPDGGKSDQEMKLQNTYESWDFINTWGIESNLNNGYPYLKEFVNNH